MYRDVLHGHRSRSVRRRSSEEDATMSSLTALRPRLSGR